MGAPTVAPSTTDLLETAQYDLQRASHAADNAENYADARMLERLSGVVDYARRCALPTASLHYRCEKSTALAHDALRVFEQAFAMYLPDALYEEIHDLVARLHDHVDDVRGQIERMVPA